MATPHVKANPKPEPKPEPKPTAPATTEVICGPHDPAVIYKLIRDNGVPRIPAIQLLGSWKHESGFDQCQKRGDSGIAWGLNSWHPGRRTDMPQRLEDQVRWAIQVEMKRDCARCYDAFINASSPYEARVAIQQSTRWGIEGNRWLYADQFAEMF